MFRLEKAVLAFTPKVINRSVAWKGEYFAGPWSLFDGAAISVDDQESPAHLHPSKDLGLQYTGSMDWGSSAHLLWKLLVNRIFISLILYFIV